MEKVDEERLFFAVVSVLGRPDSFMHIGCGDGWLVRAAWQLQARPALGIERRQPDKPWGRRVIVRDWTQAFDNIRGRYDLVLALNEETHWPSVFELVADRGHLVMCSTAGLFISSKLVYSTAATETLNASGFPLEVFRCLD